MDAYNAHIRGSKHGKVSSYALLAIYERTYFSELKQPLWVWWTVLPEPNQDYTPSLSNPPPTPSPYRVLTKWMLLSKCSTIWFSSFRLPDTSPTPPHPPSTLTIFKFDKLENFSSFFKFYFLICVHTNRYLNYTQDSVNPFPRLTRSRSTQHHPVRIRRRTRPQEQLPPPPPQQLRRQSSRNPSPQRSVLWVSDWIERREKTITACKDFSLWLCR